MPSQKLRRDFLDEIAISRRPRVDLGNLFLFRGILAAGDRPMSLPSKIAGFRQIVEAQAMGYTTGEAVDRIVERVPISEASFFAIVINIQQKAGGNLAEALGNLSGVLRDRKKMKTKIKAVSSEAKTSAYIIGSLPLFVSGMVWFTSPKYMEILWTTQTGEIALGGCVLWMGIGVFIMKNMINFDI
jgi:tight adherence protein B